jgi:hypothetical protein
MDTYGNMTISHFIPPNTRNMKREYEESSIHPGCIGAVVGVLCTGAKPSRA